MRSNPARYWLSPTRTGPRGAHSRYFAHRVDADGTCRFREFAVRPARIHPAPAEWQAQGRHRRDHVQAMAGDTDCDLFDFTAHDEDRGAGQYARNLTQWLWFQKLEHAPEKRKTGKHHTVKAEGTRDEQEGKGAHRVPAYCPSLRSSYGRCEFDPAAGDEEKLIRRASCHDGNVPSRRTAGACLTADHIEVDTQNAQPGLIHGTLLSGRRAHGRSQSAGRHDAGDP